MTEYFTRERADKLVEAVLKAISGENVLFVLPNGWQARECFETAITAEVLVATSTHIDEQVMGILYKGGGGLTFGTKDTPGRFDSKIKSDN